MLDALIRWALNHRLGVISAAVVVLISGTMTLRDLPIDVFPDLTKPSVTILTESHGMASEEVEKRVTLPLESSLGGLPRLERMRSQSGLGLSVIILDFEWGTDLYLSRQLVQEKISVARERLPRDIQPVLGPVGSLMGQIQQIALTSSDPETDPVELRGFAEWVLRPRLMTLPGVAQVIAIGGGLKQYQILVSAEKLNRYQLSMERIEKELTQISQNTPGGFLEKGAQEFQVRNIGVITSREDILNTLVGLHLGRPVLVKDIAEVKDSFRLKRGDGSFNGKASVILTIQKQPGADTVEITRRVQELVDEMKPGLPKGVEIHPDVFRQADFIETSVRGIRSKLEWGSLLVFIVLLVFLANLRMSLITLTTIPLSFLVAALVFRFFGLSVNTMTLGGLAIAIGELVDDSIVDVENIFRRLRENAAAARPISRLRVIYEASSEVRNSIVLATLIIMMVFLPLFALDGLEGRLFAPLGTAYVTALLASLAVSLTLTPVLSFYFLKTGKGHKEDTWIVRRLKAAQEKALRSLLPRFAWVAGAVILCLLAGLLMLSRMGRDFLPRFNEGTAMVTLIGIPGVSLSEANRVGLEAEKILMEIPEIKSVSRRTGRAELDEHAAGLHVSEIDVDFKGGGRPRDLVLSEARLKLKEALPPWGVSLGQPISHLIDHMMSGVSAALAIKIYGPDLGTLREKALEIERALKGTEGLVDLRVEAQTLVPQVKVHVLRDEAALVGMNPGEVTSLLETAFNGRTVAQILEDERSTDIFFQFDESSRGSLESMQKTVLKIMPDGRRVLLEDVADVYEASGPNEINREGQRRRIVLSANAEGRDLGSLVDEVQKKASAVRLPPAYQLVYEGQFESQKSASRNLLIFGLLALLGIVAILYGHFRSAEITAQILLTIPFAFIGGIFLLFAVERSFTVASLVGFVTLCGISARNGIMMISHYLHLMRKEGEDFGLAMVLRGSKERLVPVLMTASVTCLALLPLVFAKGQPGSEILHPVAVVIVGGLVTSTLLDALVTPLVFLRFGRKSAEKYLKNQKQTEILSEERTLG